MSSLNSITVQGVRSFGPSNPQGVQFQSPLTLIVGQNGSGKTTLIECLRYICTGDMPSTTVGISKNANFAHDLNINNFDEGLSQVKMKFFDVNSEPVVATRSMKSVRKKVGGRLKIECATMDGIIMKLDNRTLQKTSVASKCADMNREMASLLGVSDAVLNNVIFCHQEDSNWPLSEPKALKTRFDDIFSATKYMKAMDAMRSVQKDYTRNVGEYKKELLYLKQFQDQAKGCRQQIEADEKALAKQASDATKLREQVDPISKKLEEIGHHRKQIDRLAKMIAGLEAEKEAVQRNVNELRANISEFYTGGVEKLKEEIERFEQGKKRISGELEKKRRDLELLVAKSSALEKQKMELLTKRGKLDAEIQGNKDQVEKRDKKISEFSEQLGYTGFTRRPLLDTDIYDFLRQLEQSINQTTDDMARKKPELDERLCQAKSESEIASNAVASNNQSIVLNQTNVKQLEKEISKVNVFLQDMEHKEARISELSNKIGCKEKELKMAEKDVNEETLKDDILALNRERNEMDVNQRSLYDELRLANQQRSTRMELDMLQKDKAAKEDDLQKLLCKHNQPLNHLFHGVDIGKLRDAVEDDLTKRVKELQSTHQKLNEKRVSHKSKEKERDMCNLELKAKEKELRDAEDKIYNICKGDDITEELESIRESLEKLRFEKGTTDGSENVYKGYIKKLEMRTCCPLCERNFNDQREATNLSDKLKRDIRMLPDRSVQLRTKIEDQQKRQADLLQLQPMIGIVRNLKENEIPALRKRIDGLNAEIKSLKKEVAELEASVDLQSDDEQSVRAVQNDMGEMDTLNREIQKLTGRLSSLKQQAGISSGQRSVEAIEEDLKSLQASLDEVTSSLALKQATLSNHREKVQQLRQSINGLTKEKLEITNSMQQRIAYQEKRASLSSQRDQCLTAIEDLKREGPILKRKLEECREKEAKCESDKEARLKEYQLRLQTFENRRRIIREFNESINEFQTSGKADQLKECVRQMDTIGGELDDISSRRQEISEQNEEQERSLNQSTIKLRELKDSLAIKEKEKRIEDLVKEIAREKAEFDRLGGMITSGNEYDKIMAKHASLTKRIHEIDGQTKVLEKNLREKRDLMESDGYKDADEKYKDKIVQLTTTELAITDVMKYCKALDNAIIQYHSTKMEAINDVLREYWQKIYKHNDIDYVAIRSAEAEATDRRRAYNYRVVMCTGGTELDMRGRCSAGQKVLASVLIRIALAEVFSGNCGVLALDEPTTNLDSSNIQGLAEALVDLIEIRSQQKNFQLILITHDEQFVRMLLQGYPMEKHYRVRKNERGFSEITEMTTSDMD